MYLGNSAIQGEVSYKMGKYGYFRQLFTLACTGSGFIVCGKGTSGNKYPDCVLIYPLKQKKGLKICKLLIIAAKK